ncbi:MAG: hypothetical protein ACR2H1_10205, partial [Limisphaerales bacterium]
MKVLAGLLEFFLGRPRCFLFPSIFNFSFSIFLFFLFGCAPAEPKADLVIINGAEPGTLDPAIVTVQADSRIVRALFEGPTRLDPKTATPVPAIAARWD